MNNNPYILDILSQPKSLQTALEQFDPATLKPVAKAIQDNIFDRVLITGMGGSLYASYPAWLILADAGLPAIWVDTAELIHHTPALISSKTLFWAFSQSGRSAEIVSAMDLARMRRPAALLATVNDLESPLAKTVKTFNGLSANIPMQATVEKTVSTRTYVNSLALGQLTAIGLLGKDVEAARFDLLKTVVAMEEYLSNWASRVTELSEQLSFPKHLAILGRGVSLASAYAGSLILGEAAKYHAVAYQAGEFRHGPLELAGPDLTILLLAGTQGTRDLNRRLLKDLRGYNFPAFWIGTEVNEWQIEIPEVPAIGLPLVEILPLQLLSIHFARQIGIEPGQFFRTGKITLSE